MTNKLDSARRADRDVSTDAPHRLSDLAPDTQSMTEYDMIHLALYAALIEYWDRPEVSACQGAMEDMARLDELPPSPYRTFLSHSRRALWLLNSNSGLRMLEMQGLYKRRALQRPSRA